MIVIQTAKNYSYGSAVQIATLFYITLDYTSQTKSYYLEHTLVGVYVADVTEVLLLWQHVSNLVVAQVSSRPVKVKEQNLVVACRIPALEIVFPVCRAL